MISSRLLSHLCLTSVVFHMYESSLCMKYNGVVEQRRCAVLRYYGFLRHINRDGVNVAMRDQ